ncbi:cytotoxin Mcf [Vibrio coralliilyticus]|nr:cytotoxin Mcf [Vibrio coralliilyticus]
MNKTLIAIAISSFLVNPPVFAGHNDILKPSPSTKAGRDKPGQSADQSPSALQTNTAAEMAAFTHDPRAFLTEHTVDVIEIIKHGILPSGLSQARLEPSFGGFQVRLAEVAAADTAPAYFLGFNGRTNPTPAYIDIPKNAPNGTFLFTGSLTGCSVIVTDWSETHYRVYHDGRVGSSVLYDNVVMKADYDDYQASGDQGGVAGAYLLVKDGQWQMMLQPQQQKLVAAVSSGIKWLKREGAAGDPVILHPEPVSTAQRETSFATERQASQQRLIEAATSLGVPRTHAPKDGPIDASEPLTVTDNSALAQWQQLREAMTEAMNRELAPMRARRSALHDLIRTASGTKKARYEAEQQAVSITEQFYRERYGAVIERTRDLDRMWLWLNKKHRDGFESVIMDEPRLQGGADVTLRESYNKRKTELDKSTGPQGRRYREGLAAWSTETVPGLTPDMDAYQMMRLLLDPHSSLNARQNGALVGLIEDHYQQDAYRRSLDNTQTMVTYMNREGGNTVQLMPQRFILLSANIGQGRCLPLSRLMATALASKDGVRALAEAMYDAAAQPEQETSKAFFANLGVFHAEQKPIPGVEISVPTSSNSEKKTLSIRELTAHLTQVDVGQAGSEMLRIDTNNHTMLVGKKAEQGRSTYYFYDPNFGLFSFDSEQAMNRGLETHFVKHHYGDLYKAFGQRRSEPRFQTYHIDIEKMASYRLSTGRTVKGVYRPASDADALVVDTAASAISDTGASLQRDLQLQSALTFLEGANVADDFYLASEQLFAQEQVDPDAVIVFDNIEEVGAGTYRVPVIEHGEGANVRYLITEDPRIWTFATHYNDALESIKRRYQYHEGTLVARHGVTDVEHVDGLNSAFAVQSILSWFNNKSRTQVAGHRLAKGLHTALEVHTYVNLAQIGHGTIMDAAKIVQLYRTAMREGQVATRSAVSAIGHTVNEGVGVGFNLASVILDSYELAHAQNEAQKAVFGTQLAFDSTSLVTSAAGIGAGVAGASTAGAVLGGVGVIAGGLAVGFTALAEAFGKVTEDAKAVGRYFDAVDKAYRRGGYQAIDKTLDSGVPYHALEPQDGAVITEVDLRQGRVHFDSQYLYRTRHGKTGSGRINYFFWAGDMPRMVEDKSKAINVREGIGYGDDYADLAPGNRMLILPATPKSYISYRYQNWPGSTTRHDTGFDVIRRLEQDERFDYDFYTFPSEYVVRNITQEYVHTTIDVVLDETERQILMRDLGDMRGVLSGKLDYQLHGGGATSHIGLQTGASLTLRAAPEDGQWILDASALASKSITVRRDHLSVGGVRIGLPDSTYGELIVVDNQGDIFRIDRAAGAATLIEVNGEVWQGLPAQTKSGQSLREHLQSLVASRPDTHFIAVEAYQPDEASVGRAFYQVDQDRFIYTNVPQAQAFLAKAVLVAVGDDTAWFKHADSPELWQVSIATGAVLKQYRPIHFSEEAQGIESSRAWQEDQHVYLEVKQTLTSGGTTTWTYRVESDRMSLIAIQGDAQLMAAIESSQHGNASDTRDWFPDRRHYAAPAYDLNPQDWVDADLAEVVTVKRDDGEQNTRYWLQTGLSGALGVVKANLDEAIPRDLLLASITHQSTPSKRGFYFYSHDKHRLYFQADRGQSGTMATPVSIPDLKTVFSDQGGLYAIQNNGVLWVMNDDGQASMAGVTQDWLKGQGSDLTQALTALVDSTERSVPALSVLGLTSEAGQASSVWFDVEHKRVIVAGPNLAGRFLSYLGLSDDGQYAWVFDAQAQALFRQPVYTQTMAPQLAPGLVIVQQVEDAEPYMGRTAGVTQVTREGAQLWLETDAGVRLVLPVSAATSVEPTVVAVDGAWRRRHAENLDEALASLGRQYPLADKVALRSDGVTSGWYLTREKEVVVSAALNGQHELAYLGKDADSGQPIVYDATAGEVVRVDGGRSVTLGVFGVAVVEEASVLVLQQRRDGGDGVLALPQLAGVPRVMVSGFAAGATYRIDAQALAHYQQIVIDDHAQTATIELAVSDPTALLVQKDGDQLVLWDPESDTGIIIRNLDRVEISKLRLSVGGREIKVHTLIKQETRTDKQVRLWESLR